MDDSPASIARDVAAVSRISAVESLLQIVCENTGMRFAAVARVTGGTWTACAVKDDINFGLKPGGQLDVHTTLCKEARAARQPVAFDQASTDPTYCTHHTPRIYQIESYISVPIVRPDGEYFGNLCAIDPKPNKVSDPKTIAMFESFATLIGRQLEVERQHEETATALLDAHATAELRDQFIAVLGHDLRNPLASVGAIGEVLLKNGDLGVAKLGTRLRANTRRMSKLIDDVLDFARGRLGGGLEIRRAVVPDLQAALAQVTAELRDAHPRTAIVENFDVDGPIECDVGRVQQLLSNLVANALTHGESTTVGVDAALRDGWLVMSVRNGGAPISPQHLDRIFDPFWRSPDGGRADGLGLGLHICALIARAHGGTVEVRSAAGSETCFTARIPVQRQPA